jgi:DNA polymerase-1
MEAEREISSKMMERITLKTTRYPDARCLECPLLAQPPVEGYVENGDLNDVQAVYVAEHPGNVEVQKGIPLVGKAGQCLKLGIDAVKGDWDRSYRTNAVLCMPPYGSKVDKAAVDCCRPRLEREIGEVVRRNGGIPVMALGNHSAQTMYAIADKKTGAKITTLRGSNITVPKLGTRSYFSWNPAYILREKSKAPLFMDDIQKMLFGMVYPYPELAKSAPEPIYCLTPTDAIKAIESLKIGPVAYDIETATAITYDQIRSESGWLTDFGITDSLEYCYVFSPEMMNYGTVRAALKKSLAREGMILIAHNGKFDQLFLREKLGIEIPLHFDTMLAHYVLDENNYHDLKTIARQFLGVPDYDAEVEKYVYKKKGQKGIKWYDKVPFDVLSKYLAYDCCCTLALYHVFIKALVAENLYVQPFLDPVMAASDVLMDLERRGMVVDIPYFESQIATVSIRMAELTLEMRRIAGKDDYNPRSWVQTQPIMYDYLKFPVVTGKGVKARSTNKDALKLIVERMRKKSGDEAWMHPFIDAKLRYSRVNKMSTAYINPLQTWPNPDDHRVHTTFNLHRTVTGRLSSTDPALQVIPRPSDRWGRLIRAGFIAGPGMVLVKIDFSQAEMRVAGVESQDEYLLWCYNNDIDLHSDIANSVVEWTPMVDWEEQTVKPRSVAKIVNFGYIYDATPVGLASTFPGIIDMPIAKRIHRNYDEKLFGATAWKLEQKRKAWQNGYVQTVFGRKRRFPGIARDNRAEVGRQAINMPVQSIASDIVLKAAIKLRPMDVPMVHLVHDEIICECPLDEAEDVGNLVAEMMLKEAHAYSSDLVWEVDGSVRDRWAATTPEGEEAYESKTWSTAGWR